MTSYSAAAKQYEEQLVQLACLMATGKSRSKEAFRLRSILALLERALSDGELLIMNDLSSDLYMIEDDEILEPSSNQENSQYAVNVIKSVESSNWLRVLELLRIDVPHMSNEYRAYFRGRAYDWLGFFSSSREFYKYAIKLNPDDTVYRYLLLDSLSRGNAEATHSEASRYLQKPDAFPALTILSATILFKTTKNGDPKYNLDVYNTVADLLPSLLGDCEVVSSLPRTVIAMGYVSLGFALNSLGDHHASVKALEIAQKLDVDLASSLDQEIELIRNEAQPNLLSSQHVTIPETALAVVTFTNPADRRDNEIRKQLLAA